MPLMVVEFFIGEGDCEQPWAVSFKPASKS
jgi:hypothetical protein